MCIYTWFMALQLEEKIGTLSLVVSVITLLVTIAALIFAVKNIIYMRINLKGLDNQYKADNRAELFIDVRNFIMNSDENHQVNLFIKDKNNGYITRSYYNILLCNPEKNMAKNIEISFSFNENKIKDLISNSGKSINFNEINNYHSITKGKSILEYCNDYTQKRRFIAPNTIDDTLIHIPIKFIQFLGILLNYMLIPEFINDGIELNCVLSYEDIIGTSYREKNL